MATDDNSSGAGPIGESAPAALGRRFFLRGCLVGVALVGASAHTPYSQWNVYRQKHLLVLTNKTDGDGYATGKAVAEALLEVLPSSDARVTRAPNIDRVASLIATHQLDIAVLRHDEAAALFKGAAPFEEIGSVPLRVLYEFPGHVLISRDDFPDAHAYRVAQALMAASEAGLLPASAGLGNGGESAAVVPRHAGVIAFFDGEPLPDSGD